MKIAIIADTHFGYPRFEEDAFAQAGHALDDAEKKADAIIIAGDIFDVKIPRLETLKRAADIFSKISKPLYVIHGNHERRSRDMVNPVQLLAKLSNIRYVHAETLDIGTSGERVAATFMGSVPEELARNALGKLMEQEKLKIPREAFKILVMHQSISELVYGDEEELSFDDLRPLLFDLVIDGHIHKHHVEMEGKLIIPGSTVITQLRSDEQGERGYVLYDTHSKKGEFISIPSRLFFFTEMKFGNADLSEVKGKIDSWIAEMRANHRDAILKIKLSGTLKEGLGAGDISLSYHDGIYVQNGLNSESIGEKIKRMREQREEKLSMRELAVRELREKLKGKITLFEPVELFEKLAEGPEEAAKYLNIEQ